MSKKRNKTSPMLATMSHSKTLVTLSSGRPAFDPLQNLSKAPVIVGTPEGWTCCFLKIRKTLFPEDYPARLHFRMNDSNPKTCPTSARQTEYSRTAAQPKPDKHDGGRLSTICFQAVRCRSSRMLMKWMSHCPPAPTLPPLLLRRRTPWWIGAGEPSIKRSSDALAPAALTKLEAVLSVQVQSEASRRNTRLG